MSNINRLPSGLLGFLGIKNGGAYPRQLTDQLLPTWDLATLYASANSETSSTVVAQNLGSQSYVTVPNGESWLVMYASAATGTLGAGQSIQLALQSTDAAALVTIALSDMSQTATVGGRCLVTLPQPVWLPPGSTFGVVATLIAAGPVNVTLGMRFARFPN